MAAIKTPAEMERIRAAHVALVAKQPKPEPEPLQSRPLITLQIRRYTNGNIQGMFKVLELIENDANGRPLKRPQEKVVADGHHFFPTIAAITEAIRRRVF